MPEERHFWHSLMILNNNLTLSPCISPRDLRQPDNVLSHLWRSRGRCSRAWGDKPCIKPLRRVSPVPAPFEPAQCSLSSPSCPRLWCGMLVAKRTSSLLKDQPPKDLMDTLVLHTEPQPLPLGVLRPCGFCLFFLGCSSASDPQPQKGQGRRSGKRVLTWQPTSNQPSSDCIL